MKIKRIATKDLKGKIIDVHSHVGVSLKSYATLSYPYAQSLEDLYFRQKAYGIDVNVVFAFTSELYADLNRLTDEGIIAPAKSPLSPSPYETENKLVFKEVYDFFPEISDRFLPFICIDTERDVKSQLNALEKLEKKYPIYGIKVTGVLTQSHVIKLLSKSKVFLDYAESHNIPMLFHTTPTTDDEYSHVSDIFKIIEKRPKIRFCLAHCIVFHRGYLQKADRASNVWVDTAALKIQVDVLNDIIGTDISKKDVIDADFTDYRKVMKFLCDEYPNTIIWGTDSPAYTYITKRRQGENTYRDFNYKGNYEDEVTALKSLPENQMRKVSNTNTLKFLFGGDKKEI